MEEDRTGDTVIDASDTLPSEPVRNETASDIAPSDLLPLHYLDPPLNVPHGSKIGGYISFSTRKSVETTDENDDESKKRIKAAKKRIFPPSIAPSFAEAAETLRNERRDEFSPIYPNESAETVARRQSKRRPAESLLAKRIRFDDLKRKREQNEAQQRFAQQFHYGPYSYPSYEPMQYQNEQLRSFQMAEFARVQQEHSGFWPELQQQRPPPPPPPNENSPWFYSNAPPPPSEPYPY